MIFLQRIVWHSVSILVLLAAPSFAQSQRPPEQEQRRTTGTPDTKNDQRGTKESPLVIQGIPTQPTTEETKQHQEDRDFQRTATNATLEMNQRTLTFNALIVVLTAALVGVGLLQAYIYWKQAGSLERTIHKMDEIAKSQSDQTVLAITESARAATAMETTAKAMRDSAEIADKALRIEHRAHVIVQALRMTGFEVGQEPHITYTLLNAGVSLARITNQVSDIGFAPRLPDIPIVGPLQEKGPTILAGRESKRLVSHTDRVTPELYAAIAEGRAFVFVWGRIDYEDIFETPRITRFCFRYHFPEKNWAFHYQPGYYESD